MSAMTELSSCLELALAGHCPAPKAAGSGRLLETAAGAEAFAKLLQHWHSLPEASRPRLRGLTVSREPSPALLLVLEIGGRLPFLLLSVEGAGAGALPSIAGIWPYSRWWEEELGGFERVSFARRGEESGVAWRRA
jgi:hypothetical protein